MLMFVFTIFRFEALAATSTASSRFVHIEAPMIVKITTY